MHNQDRKTALYRTIWRWHFYAGLFVLPFIIILSLSGALYLFKPQIERWEERAYQELSTANAVSPNQQLQAVLDAYPGARFMSYRLPERAGDAPLIHIGLADGHSMRDVFVSPQGQVLGALNPENRVIAIDRKIHGQMLLGKRGSWLVELVASWAIVMILTGLYLWWPSGSNGRRLAGIVWPRIRLGERAFLRDLHAVTGFWVAGLALILLVTGLPWAAVWGDAFRAVRAEMGWVKGAQDWTIGGEATADPHAEHDHEKMMEMQAAGIPLTSLADMVQKAEAENLAFPVLVTPPGAPQRFGAPAGMTWTMRSDSQNRPLRTTITYDMATGEEVSRSGFAEEHAIDKIVAYGIAWHEGQLFGWVNQLIGALSAAALITLAVSGFLMWRRRKPDDQLGAPALPAPVKLRGIAAIILVLAALLPLLAASLILLWLVERLVLPRLPKLSRWLGLCASASSR